MTVLGGNIWSPPSDAAAADYRRFTADHPQEEVLGLFASENPAGSISVSPPVAVIAPAIIKAIEDGVGFSIIRVGDGEGNCLFDYDQYPALREYILHRISYMHFGDGQVVLDAREKFHEYVVAAIQSADMLGIPEEDSIKKGFNTPDESLDVRAIVGNRTVALKVANLATWAQTRVSPWTNRDLLGYYAKILGGRDRVGVISGYPELAPLLRDKFGIGEVVHHEIPRQAVFVKSSDRTNSFHYPDEFARIVDSLDPDPGMPYLVSAGLLAKHYCRIIKERGGVAIDTGSVPEIWLGIPNRGLSSEFIDRWKLTTTPASV